MIIRWTFLVGYLLKRFNKGWAIVHVTHKRVKWCHMGGKFGMSLVTSTFLSVFIMRIS